MSWLAVPCGVAPGFDPKHIAGDSVMFSGIAASGGSFLNLLNGQGGAKTGTPTSQIMNVIGQSLYVPNNDVVSFANYPAISTNGQTMAAIYQPDAASSTNSRQIINNSASSTTGMSLFANAGGSWAFTFGAGLGTLPNPPVVSAGVPYFYAGSFNSALGTFNYIVTRLDNGQSWSGAVAQAASVVAGDTTFYVGNRGTNTRQSIGKIAAGMHSAKFLPIAALKMWGADPWSFWYPK